MWCGEIRKQFITRKSLEEQMKRNRQQWGGPLETVINSYIFLPVCENEAWYFSNMKKGVIVLGWG